MEEYVGNIIRSRHTNDGSSRGERALVVTAVLTGISAMIVAMRMYARAGIMKIVGREDWMILASLVLAIVYLGLVAAQYHFGLGRHSDDLSDQELEQQLKRLWVAIPMYNASLGCTKIAILFQYLRIFPNFRFRIACYTVMGIVVLYSTWAIVSGFVNCVPVAKFWEKQLPGTCLSFEAVWFFNASMNIATDLTLLVLPMPLLSQLHLPLKQKIALIAVFAIGVLVVITSILRLSSLQTVAKSVDTSWSNVGAAYWTAAECNVAIICACLPFLRPLVNRIFPHFLSMDSYHRYTRNPTKTTGRSQQRRTAIGLNSGLQEYGLSTIDIDTKRNDPNLADRNNKSPYGVNGGIEVTTEMTLEVTPYEESSSSQRGLIMHP